MRRRLRWSHGDGIRAAPVIVAASLLLAGSSRAQVSRSVAEVQADYQSLTANLARQFGVSGRVVIDRGSAGAWTLDAIARRAFDDDGLGFGVTYARPLDPDWVVAAGVSSSATGFFLPRARADVAVGRKWLSARQLLTSVTGRMVVARDGHRDRAAGFEAVYFAAPVILQVSSIVNWSSPGNVASAYHTVALTAGDPDRQTVLVRGGTGREAYQPLSANTAIVNFQSSSVSMTWRRWVGPKWGLAVGNELYVSSVYRRSGISVGALRRLSGPARTGR
jgi:YaiO family outer membrane protein